jgi:hypothetical protein
LPSIVGCSGVKCTVSAFPVSVAETSRTRTSRATANEFVSAKVCKKRLSLFLVMFLCSAGRRRFFCPGLVSRGVVRGRGQGWPSATAGGGAQRPDDGQRGATPVKAGTRLTPRLVSAVSCNLEGRPCSRSTDFPASPRVSPLPTPEPAADISRHGWGRFAPRTGTV